MTQGPDRASKPHSPETILELRRQCLESFDKRRSYEWKISLALWAGVGTMTGFLFPLRSDVAAAAKMMTKIFFALGLTYAYWALHVARRQIEDRLFADQCARSLAADRLTVPDPPQATVFDGLNDFAFWTKSLITACFLTLAWHVLFRVPGLGRG